MFEYDVKLSDKELLCIFLKDVHSFLESISSDKKGLFIDVLDKELVYDYKEAWLEFDKYFHLETKQGVIRDLPNENFVKAGLIGKQLRFKLKEVSKRSNEWRSLLTKKCLKKLFDTIDTVLDSLLAATGIDEAIKELKDVLNNSLD